MGHNAMEMSDVGVLELTHDCCFLKEFNFVWLRGIFIQWLDGHFQSALWTIPGPFVHITKMTRPYSIFNSDQS